MAAYTRKDKYWILSVPHTHNPKAVTRRTMTETKGGKEKVNKHSTATATFSQIENLHHLRHRHAPSKWLTIYLGTIVFLVHLYYHYSSTHTRPHRHITHTYIYIHIYSPKCTPHSRAVITGQIAMCACVSRACCSGCMLVSLLLAAGATCHRIIHPLGETAIRVAQLAEHDLDGVFLWRFGAMSSRCLCGVSETVCALGKWGLGLFPELDR